MGCFYEKYDFCSLFKHQSLSLCTLIHEKKKAVRSLGNLCSPDAGMISATGLMSAVATAGISIGFPDLRPILPPECFQAGVRTPGMPRNGGV
jgi:hypothetical protein